MDFIDFEAEVEGIDDEEKEDFNIISSDDDDSFIDDCSDMSESVCKYYAFQNAQVNIDDVLKNVHDEAISDLDNASEFTDFSNADLAEKLSEITTFCGSEKRLSDFEKSLLIPQGVWSIDSFFYAVCYAIRYKKTGKVDHCDNFKDEIGVELYEKLLGLKGRLQLKLDHYRFEGQCFEINKALIEYGCFLRVFELKKKFGTLMKKDSEKQEVKKKMFLAASWKSLEALILLALNTAEGNELSLRLFILYRSQTVTFQ